MFAVTSPEGVFAGVVADPTNTDELYEIIKQVEKPALDRFVKEVIAAWRSHISGVPQDVFDAALVLFMLTMLKARMAQYKLERIG